MFWERGAGKYSRGRKIKFRVDNPGKSDIILFTMAGERELPDISRIGIHPSGALLIPDGISVLPADPTQAGEPPRHPKPAIAELRAVRDEFVVAARRASKAQVDLWRQVPLLALQADGRSGYLDKYSYAYNYGYWELSRGTNVCVDLETGELMDSHSALPSERSNKPPVPAYANEVLKVLGDPEQLDATVVIKDLKRKIKEPTFEHYNEEEIRQWRERIIAKNGLTPMFSRRKVVTPEGPALLEPQVRNVTPLDATS